MRETTIRAIHRGRPTRRASRRSGSSRRGVSDVVGTILLLALTVTLFSSIFFFVNTFPRPPAQPSSQFSAQLIYGGVGGKSIVRVSILHLAGPTLTGSNVLVYLFSSVKPSAFTGPFTLAQGLNGSATWNLGQTWNYNVTSYNLKTGDNITISIVSSVQLLFRITLPGQNPVLPPQFVLSGISPASPIINQGFSVYVQIVDPALKPYSVYANVSQVPGTGLPALNLMSYSAATGQFALIIPNGATAAGTYFIFVNASDNNSGANTVAIPAVIGAGPIPPASVLIGVSPSPPVNGTAGTIYATVRNTAAAASNVNVTFRVGGNIIGVASGPISAGGTATFSHAWTPTSTGTAILSAQANVSGGGTPTGALNVTVFPKMLFIAHNVLAGTRLTNNTSAYLAEQIQAAGFPFTAQFIACNALLPAAATLQTYNVVVIDFGSTATGTCAATPATTEMNKITGAMSAGFTNFLLVGSSFFSATTCASYTATFLTDFGIKGTVGTCVAHGVSATAAVTYAPTLASGFRQDGIGALTLNKTFQGSAGFEPYNYFSQGSNHGFLSTASGVFGSWFKASGNGRGIAIGTDPALLMTTLPAPASAAWGVAAGGTAVVYNVLNYASGFSTSTSPGRAFSDYAIAGATLVGLSAAHLTNVYVTLRANGPVADLVAASLTVNGTIAVYGGQPVSTAISLLPNGQNVTIVLTWEAPTSGAYNLAIVLQSFGSSFGSLTQLPINIINKPTNFAP